MAIFMVITAMFINFVLRHFHLGIAILYTVIMYMLLGDLFTTFFSSLPAG